ncbi:uncharacterized protein KY384_000816 [Bacidia gigantensis]|uniref:uncharacterized protein n=1 Tax=Bacidia gigantensis TaxID=2732470 RepID=UPI001D03FDF5|nr:uncharacterized protein KY384_000816 [Bacidia gigantensis]KAG8526054.1 hypothetical protein KY384_000816 [Bacidia gigantensis]
MQGLKSRYRALPLFASPLEEEEHSHHHGHPPPPGPLKHSESELFVPDKQLRAEASELQAPHESIAFREREEASSIELFYDLFFVANLSTFTGAHTIDNETSIKSYIGFFALLWFNWLQVTLYDVRFGVDSIFERACKALHLGVMIAFAVVGTNFTPTDTATNVSTFRQFSVILLISRLVLIVQYSYILLWVRGHKNVMLPILAHIAAFVIGAIICLGLTFSFNSTTTSVSYLGWYVIAAMEALVVFTSTSRWRSISFKHTNLNERCGLLTLIILGEGVIVLTKAMTNVTKGEGYTAAMVGQIISAVLIIYFIYMLYFDQVDAKRFGTIRQQFWALAHFPFHISLVLLLEGCSRFISFRNAIEVVLTVQTYFVDAYGSFVDQDNVSLPDLGANLTKIANTYLKDNLQADLTKYNITPYVDALVASGNATSDEAFNDADQILNTITTAIFKYFKIEAPKSMAKKASGDKDPFSDLTTILSVYDLVFQYFFAAAGCTLVMMAIMVALSKKGKVAGDYAVISIRAVIGAGLALVALVSTNYTARDNFLYTPWMLPTVLFAILIVVIVDAVFGYLLPAPKAVEAHGHGHGGAHEHSV